MNIPPSEAKELTMWEYGALVWNWNQIHNPDAKKEPGEPDDRDRLTRFHRANMAKQRELN